ncbi:hypothetical protein, partial [Pseudomonas umsongensis]|uniref:hypothetical protein n=1 Tax=Pseudomonas umsongensis TaxID=198618 RepID=UPI00200A429B
MMVKSDAIGGQMQCKWGSIWNAFSQDESSASVVVPCALKTQIFRGCLETCTVPRRILLYG